MTLNCNDCKERATCQKVCQRMEAYLRKNKIFSSKYIRPEITKKKRERGLSKYREIPFSSLPKEVQQRIGVSEAEMWEDYR